MREQFEAWMTSEQWFHGSDFKWDEHRNCYSEFGIHIAYKAYLAGAASMQADRDACHLAEMAWEKAMMEACGEDGVRSVADKFRELQAERDQLAAENVALKDALRPSDIPSDWTDAFGDTVVIEHDATGDNQGHSVSWSWVGNQEEVIKSVLLAVDNGIETPATDRFLAEVRASVIPEGYVLIPQEMHLSSEAMEGICFHCGDGGHQFGEFTDGTLFVGEVDYGDGKKVHGLHIATADYPEEGCETICEFAAQLRNEVNV